MYIVPLPLHSYFYFPDDAQGAKYWNFGLEKIVKIVEFLQIVRVQLEAVGDQDERH